MLGTLRRHWPEYLIEAVLLGLFMVSAGSFGVLLEHPGSPVHRSLGDPWLRRGLMGCAMGLTAILLVYSPLGKRSGAHMNPAVTLSFLGLGRVAPRDALFYVLAQFAGGALGLLACARLLGPLLAEPHVNYVATVPGERGIAIAFAAELAISFVLMTVVLSVSSRPALARYTGLCAGALVALYITVEAPLSGMSMNPARSFGSALLAHAWPVYWIYVAAPLSGMILAALVHSRSGRAETGACAKLHHQNPYRCIFCGANS